MTSNKDYLSQEEIDALLRQNSEEDNRLELEDSQISVDDYLSLLEQDALGEIGNITFGSAATALSTLLGKKVDITTPRVSAIANSAIESEFPKPHVSIHVKYVDGFQGINLLVIKNSDAQVIADLMLGGDGTVPLEELNEIHISAVQEAMNQMMGSSATSMSTIFNRFVNISPPGIDIVNLSDGEGAASLYSEEVYIKISFRLIIGDLIDSTIMQLLPIYFAKDMVSILMGGGEPMQEEAPVNRESLQVDKTDEIQSISAVFEDPIRIQEESLQQPVLQQQPVYQQAEQPVNPSMYQQPLMAQQPPFYQQQPMAQQQGAGQPMYQQPFQQPVYQQSSTPAYGTMPNRNIQVQPVQYANFSNEPSLHADETNLNLLLDIPLKVTVELGRTQKLIRDILEFSQGSIIELDKLAGEPVDILLNNKLIAKGEVVVIDENFGVRVTDIVSQWDRIQKLQ